MPIHGIHFLAWESGRMETCHGGQRGRSDLAVFTGSLEGDLHLDERLIKYRMHRTTSSFQGEL